MSERNPEMTLVNMENAIVERYGAPTSRWDAGEPGGVREKGTLWVFPQTVVRLVWTTNLSPWFKAQTLTLIYQPKTGTTAQNQL